MENLNKKNFDPDGKVNSSMMEWKIWSDKYFPAEEKINNWNDDDTWVLFKP
tara:strand:- start:4 stop:156 length:153 start_codon:yes stop_codon:yes gene_type:complete